MTKTFERFLRSFSDDELMSFAQDRARVGPPYWKVMRLALRIEATRRGLRLDEVPAELAAAAPTEPDTRTGTA